VCKHDIHVHERLECFTHIAGLYVVVISLIPSVSVLIYLSVRALTSESLGLETSFLVCRYSFITSRSRSSIKVTRSRSRSYEQN